MSTIDVFDAEKAEDLTKAIDIAKSAILAYNASKPKISAEEDETEESAGPVKIPPDPLLIGVDPAIYRQAETAINAKKAHVMLYGPPGTGKTELAKYIAEQCTSKPYTIVTGSADWTSQDLIGGYQPMGGGEIEFIPGIMLKKFDAPFIIDELNRCDIDKVLGPMFTVLSGQTSTLPYRVDVKKADSEQYEILGTYQPSAKLPKISPGSDWRIIATINTEDKASLYQMSYALSRRFAWIYVDAPQDLDEFVVKFVARKGLGLTSGTPIPIATAWRSVNVQRTLGAAPFIDMINYCIEVDKSFDFSAPPNAAMTTAYFDGFMVNVMPMLDGIQKQPLKALAVTVAEAFGADEKSPETAALARQMESIGL